VKDEEAEAEAEAAYKKGRKEEDAAAQHGDAVDPLLCFSSLLFFGLRMLLLAFLSLSLSRDEYSSQEAKIIRESNNNPIWTGLDCLPILNGLPSSALLSDGGWSDSDSDPINVVWTTN